MTFSYLIHAKKIWLLTQTFCVNTQACINFYDLYNLILNCNQTIKHLSKIKGKRRILNTSKPESPTLDIFLTFLSLYFMTRLVKQDISYHWSKFFSIPAASNITKLVSIKPRRLATSCCVRSWHFKEGKNHWSYL